MAETESKQGKRIITPLDISILELSKAIEIAKHNTEYFTEDFKDVLVSKKSVEISIENAEFILLNLQKINNNRKNV